MRFFSIHTRPGQSPAGAAAAMAVDAAAVKVVPSGFSWLAALFTPLWLLWHRLWWGLAGYVGLMLALALVYSWVDIADPADLLIGLAMAFLFGASAAELRRWHLARAGWPLVAIVAARNAQEAMLLHARQAMPAATAYTPGESAGLPPRAAHGAAGGLSALPKLV